MESADRPSRENAAGDFVRISNEVSRAVGVVGGENEKALERGHTRLVGKNLRDHSPKLGGACRREPPDGDVGKDVLSVYGGEGRVGGGPEVGGLHHQRRKLIFHSRLQVVLEVVGGVAQ